MKRVIPICILLLFFLKLNAQFSENNAIYLAGGINVGNFWGMNLNLNYILNNNYSFQAGISGLFREPKSKPEDFTSGLTVAFTLGLSSYLYYDEMDTYQILFGKIFKINKIRTIRFNIAGGIGYTFLTEAINWKPATGFPLTDNYTYDIVKHGTISFIINPQVEFPFTRFAGVTLSPMLQINKYRTYIGIGVGAMLGLLREKTNQNKE
jgi:hypothetical protein